LSDRDDDLRQYNIALTEEEIENTFANLMILEWLKPLINSIEILKAGYVYKRLQDILKCQFVRFCIIRLRKRNLRQEVDRLTSCLSLLAINSLSDLGKV